MKLKQESIKIGKVDVSGREYITFMIRKTDKSDIYNLYCLDNDEINKYGIAWIDSLRTSKKIAKNFKQRDSYNIQCVYSAEMEKWRPVNITEDRIDNLATINELLK